MLIAAVILAALAVALAWPVPILLARARWTPRAPGFALALWQSIALAGGLSMIGSLLTYGLIPFGDSLPAGLRTLGGRLIVGSLPPGTRFDHVLALCCALLLGFHLLLNLAATFVRSERQRRRHLLLIELLSEPMRGRTDTRIVDHAAPVAYCLPGATRSITVLSAGLLLLLDADELQAVIAHERGHLRQQHHLVLLAFKSWHSALPWFPIANRAENAVALLVEMLADDHARHVVDDRTLARAIVLVGSAGHADPATFGPLPSAPPAPSGPSTSPAPSGPSASPASSAAPAPRTACTPRTPGLTDSRDDPFDLVTPRVRRLLTDRLALPPTAGAVILVAACALLAVPTALLLLT